MKKLNRKGQGMTEYILIVALIALAALGAWRIFGTSVQGQVSNISTKVANPQAG